MSDSQLSVGAALGYAWSLWRSHWREIWGAFALNALACTVLCAGLFAQNWLLIAAAGVGLLFTMYSVYGAMVRLAFAAEHPDDPEFRLGVLGLQWRKMELRMLGAHVLLIIFLLILALLLAIALAAPLMGVIMAKGVPITAASTPADLPRLLGPAGTQALNLGTIALQMALTFVAIRLSLYLVATGASRKVAVLRTWKLTRGHFWQIFAATLIIGLPTVLIMSVGVGAGLSLDGRPAPLAPGETFLYSLICGGWAGAAAMPLAAGVQAYFYRNLKTAD
ncbi:MAG TPA: hypothetical protein VIJ94_12790 [Caulobacteraceae bacterium]